MNAVDLAVLEALRYGRGLRADELTAVHIMIDAARADQLRKRWDYYELETPLRIVDCPDRRLLRAAQELVAATRNEYPDTNFTVLLPRRGYAPLLARLLHDRTADKIARAISRIPDAAATIVPYDVQSRIRQAFPGMFEERIARLLEKLQEQITRDEQQLVESYEHPQPQDGYSGGRADRWAPRHRRRTRRGSQPDSQGGQDYADRRDRRYDGRAAREVLATRGHGHAPRAAAAGHRKAAPIPQDHRSAGAVQLTDPTP